MPKIQAFQPKLFPGELSGSGQMKTLFAWPIKVDYWLAELAEDYPHTTTRDPEDQFLYIMARKPARDKL